MLYYDVLPGRQVSLEITDVPENRRRKPDDQALPDSPTEIHA